MTIAKSIFEFVRKKGGVYKSEIISTFNQNYTRAEINQAIKEAKKLGVYSVPEMRGHNDTFYQAD